jgi:hypothetical protein
MNPAAGHNACNGVPFLWLTFRQQVKPFWHFLPRTVGGAGVFANGMAA